MLKNIFFIYCCFILSSIQAQSSKTGNWLAYVGNNVLSKKINLHNEFQYRAYDFASDFNQLLLRFGVGYNLSENNNNVLMGYAYIYTENYSGNVKSGFGENRLWQQFVTKQNFSRFALQHRYRFEERWINNTDMKFRMRYALIMNAALSKPTMGDNTWYLSAFNEVFINTRNNPFDRNRIYGGIGYMLNKKLKIEFGYLSQRTSTNERGQATLWIFNNMPFSH